MGGSGGGCGGEEVSWGGGVRSRDGGGFDNQELRMFWLDMEGKLVGNAIWILFKLAVAIVQKSRLSIFLKGGKRNPP